jgi:hypothetical protein
MRVVSTMIRISATSSPDGGLMDHITNCARQVEARGIPGVWIGDSQLGRGRSTLDSLQVMTALAAVNLQGWAWDQRPAAPAPVHASSHDLAAALAAV